MMSSSLFGVRRSLVRALGKQLVHLRQTPRVPRFGSTEPYNGEEAMPDHSPADTPCFWSFHRLFRQRSDNCLSKGLNTLVTEGSRAYTGDEPAG